MENKYIFNPKTVARRVKPRWLAWAIRAFKGN